VGQWVMRSGRGGRSGIGETRREGRRVVSRTRSQAVARICTEQRVFGWWPEWAAIEILQFGVKPAT
jgi:hypothetical protein